MRALSIQRLCIRRCCELPRRFSLSGLACFLSGDLAPQDLWNSKKIEKAAAPVARRTWRCCKLSRRFSLSGLACFLSGDLAPQDLWNSEKIERRLAAPELRVVWRHCCGLPRRFSLSGLACFLSGDLAPQDLWNSKKIEKAAVMSPNLVDYLLV
jgi:hypothetical protein